MLLNYINYNPPALPEPVCVRARILPLDAVMVTPSGRVLRVNEQGWEVGELELDGRVTPVVTLDTEVFAGVAWAWLEHDPVSKHIYLLETPYNKEQKPNSSTKGDQNNGL